METEGFEIYMLSAVFLISKEYNYLSSLKLVQQNTLVIIQNNDVSNTGKFPGQIYSYPERRWKKKRHYFMFPEERTNKTADVETGEAGENEIIKLVLRCNRVTGQ